MLPWFETNPNTLKESREKIEILFRNTFLVDKETPQMGV
jgi:hypothetical protein